MIIKKIKNIVKIIKNIDNRVKLLESQMKENNANLEKVDFGINEKIKLLDSNIAKIDSNIAKIDSNIAKIDSNIAKIDDRELETIKALCLKIITEKEKTLPIIVKTDYKIARDSPDYIVPRGTKNDNSKYYEFNSKLYRLLGSNRIKLLDIGCAGGGFVQSIIEDGSFAIGLEGSDYSKLINRAAWRIIPNNLFTCDVTKPFSVCNSDNEQILFDVITAWELMEHIKEEDIPILLKNIKNHLTDNGLFICSIATFEDFDPVSGTRWHQTVKPKEWWLKILSDNGFIELEQTIINKGDWLRGSGHVNMDWTEDMNMGFHLVLKKKL